MCSCPARAIRSTSAGSTRCKLAARARFELGRPTRSPLAPPAGNRLHVVHVRSGQLPAPKAMPDLRQARRGQGSSPSARGRCADVDLNRWLGGVYAVPAADDDDEDGLPTGTVQRRAGVTLQRPMSSRGRSGERQLRNRTGCCERRRCSQHRLNGLDPAFRFDAAGAAVAR